MGRLIIGFTSGASGAVILAALVAVGYVFNDINNFFDDAMRDMEEFKVSSELQERFSSPHSS